jgi:predicted O-methyltransferase YrrM
VARLPRCRDVLVAVGVFPIRDHYYEPQFDLRGLRRDPADPRPLPGIDWNEAGQLALLGRLDRADELAGIGAEPAGEGVFHFGNGTFEMGDAEFWYQLVRRLKPRRIFEIGSGYSTLMAARALAKNRAEDPGYACRHVCVEPYEMAWLEGTGVEVRREKVEDLPASFFAELEDGDILFIDSSHVIRPEGDVLFEYLELLPTLAVGVVVHVHDIFSPRNYPAAWLRDEVRFWNEQYLLEAFLAHNRDWEITAALNWLKHAHPGRLKAVCPYLTEAGEPGSFYLRRVRRGPAPAAPTGPFRP